VPEVDRAGVLAEVAPNLMVAVRRSIRGSVQSRGDTPRAPRSWA
jgi:hypothetical protein